jgi:hypothetical protein
MSRFYFRHRFQDFFFFKQAFLFIKSVVKDVFVGVAFILVTVCAQLFSNRRLESVFSRCEMYSGGTILTA